MANLRWIVEQLNDERKQEARNRIAAAQRARWAKLKQEQPTLQQQLEGLHNAVGVLERLSRSLLDSYRISIPALLQRRFRVIFVPIDWSHGR